MRALKTVYEALQKIKIEVLQDWLVENKGSTNDYAVYFKSEELSNLLLKRSPYNFQRCTQQIDAFFAHMEQFDTDIHDGKFGPMAVFWQSFIEMVQTLLDFIKSMRIGDWNLHLNSSSRMLPWFHAYDRVNYARHFSYCWAAQSNLQENHPEIYQVFQQGGFCTKRTFGNFNLLPPDQVIEQTINKEQKGAGGIIGITTSEGSIQRWVLSSHVYAAISRDFKTSIGIDDDNNSPKDLQETRKQFDENCVKSCYDLLNQWCNPFKESESIISISSGVAADKVTETDLLNAYEIRKSSLKEFLSDRVFTNKIPFYSVIKKKNLRTFESLNKKKVSVLKNATVALKI